MTIFKRYLTLLTLCITAIGFVQTGHAESDFVATSSTLPSNKVVSGQTGLTKDTYINALYVFEQHRQNLKTITENAENGDNKAQHKLGHVYQNGYGVTKSDVVALMWYTISTHNGFRPADNDKIHTENYMAADQIMLAHQMADLWLSKH